MSNNGQLTLTAEPRTVTRHTAFTVMIFNIKPR